MTPRGGPARHVGKVLTHEGVCRSCHAPIYWAELEGRRHPVDKEPSEKGNLQLFRRPDGSIRAERRDAETAQKIRDAAFALGATHTLRTSHFATCPQAGEWRRDRS